MFTQDVCEGEGHLGFPFWKVALFDLREREGGESLACFALADGGEVEVDEGGFEATVAKVGRELVKLDAAFEHVGGVAKTPKACRCFGQERTRRAPKG